GRVRVDGVDDACAVDVLLREPVPGEEDVVDIHGPAVDRRLVVPFDALADLHRYLGAVGRDLPGLGDIGDDGVVGRLQGAVGHPDEGVVSEASGWVEGVDGAGRVEGCRVAGVTDTEGAAAFRLGRLDFYRLRDEAALVSLAAARAAAATAAATGGKEGCCSGGAAG